MSFIQFLTILGIIFSFIYQYDPLIATQAYSENSIKIISSDKMSGMQGMSGMSNNMSGMQGMSGMSNNMSGMQGMSGMSNNMSGMQGMSGMSNNMSGMQGMSGMRGLSGMYGITSNDEISVFLEWMLVIILGLVGVPFAWVILRERRRKSNRTTRPAK